MPLPQTIYVSRGGELWFCTATARLHHHEHYPHEDGVFAFHLKKDLVKYTCVINVITVIRYNLLSVDHTIEWRMSNEWCG